MKKILYRLLLPMLLLLACSHKEQPGESQLVVEGWIENGGHPVVMVSESIGVTTGAIIDARAMIDHIAKWAKVSVSDGEETVVLTGMPSSEAFPPYVFTTSRMTGQVGRTYSLKVEYKDYLATAETVIPQPVPIDTLYIREVKDSLGTIICGFTDPEESGNYYKAFSRTEGKDTRFHPSAVAYASDENLSGYTELFLYSTQRLMDYVDVPNIREGDKVEVKLCTLTPEMSRFWTQFETIVSSNVLDMRPNSNQNAQSNMQGALGYWAGYGVDAKAGIRKITVEDPAASAAAE